MGRIVEAQPKRRLDTLWWLAAGAAAIGVQQIPRQFPANSGLTPEVVVQVALLVVGALAGMINPVRPWRWAVAALAATACADIVHLGDNPLAARMFPLDLWRHVVDGSPMWVAHAVPVLIGAYVGAFLVSARRA